MHYEKQVLWVGQVMVAEEVQLAPLGPLLLQLILPLELTAAAASASVQSATPGLLRKLLQEYASLKKVDDSAFCNTLWEIVRSFGNPQRMIDQMFSQ